MFDLLRRAAPAAAVAGALVGAGTALATHGEPEKFPAYYDGDVVLTLMGPSGNSQNPNQEPSACLGLGPDFRDNEHPADAPFFFTLSAPGATQMYCPDGSRKHDMIVTAVPGDPGYSPIVQMVSCRPGPAFTVLDMPYTSEAEIRAGVADGRLTCALGLHRLSPIIEGS
jgi:hypothetical protein